MLQALRITYHYILIGIQTGLALITNTPPPEHTLPPVPFSQEYKSPISSLKFFFDIPAPKPTPTPVTASSGKSTDTKTVLEVRKTKPIKPIKTTEKNIVKSNVDDAIVNILCVERLGNLVRSTTGSGVIISSRGIILTNAHVAIDLIKPDNLCTVRIGSLARDAYVAEVLYIPDAWIRDNKEYISAGIVQATTGEHDFALLQIVSSITGSSLPLSFNNISPNTEVLDTGDNIQTVGYPAERVGLFSADSKLYRIHNDTVIKSLYSFGETTSDLISTGKVSNAEQGSSGGAIIKDGELIGIIANVNNGTINGLSMGYIESYLAKHPLNPPL